MIIDPSFFNLYFIFNTVQISRKTFKTTFHDFFLFGLIFKAANISKFFKKFKNYLFARTCQYWKENYEAGSKYLKS